MAVSATAWSTPEQAPRDWRPEKARLSLACAVISLLLLPAWSPVTILIAQEPATELKVATPVPPTTPSTDDTLPPASPWDAPYAVDIARGAVEAREYSFSVGKLKNFRARAEGHVYFQSDVGDRGRTYLVRADQVALRVAWSAEYGSQQTIVGRRSQRFFPEDIHYHLDHLSVLLDNFGDYISLGDETEVKDVLHPAAPGALDFYEYRLVDSMEIRIPSKKRSRLYKLEVRPRDLDVPGVVGTMFVERDSKAVPRMSFTFTRASYIDTRVDYILVTLEAKLLEGEFWLPDRQQTVIRRRVRWLDFPISGVIQTVVRVTDYELNDPTPPDFPYGGRISSFPEGMLREYDEWNTDLYAHAPDRWEPVPSLDDVSREAREIVESRYLSGRSPVRLYVPGVSNVLRSRRAEGWLLGGGVSVTANAASSVTAWAGYGFARKQAEWRVGYSYEVGSGGIRVDGYQSRYTDIGPFTAASGVISTLGFELRGDDFTDPYFRHGAGVEAWWAALGGRMSLGGLYEEQVSAELVADPAFGGPPPRPVRPIEDGRMFELQGRFDLAFGPAIGLNWVTELSGDVGWLDADDQSYTRWLLELTAVGGDPSTGPEYGLHGAVGIGTGVLPAQRLFLLGGRQTVPGYDFRDWTGDKVAYLSFIYSYPVVQNWVRVRVIGAGGWTDIGDVSRAGARVLGTKDSYGVRGALGGGLGLFFDVLRVDAAHGLRDGVWEWFFSVNPAFWPAL